MRYKAEFLLDCMLLRMKSRKTYEHLRKAKLLPLPSRETVRRRISSSNATFGFSDLALENMRKALSGMSFANRLGCLMFDEIHLKKEFTWNSQTNEWEGIVNFGRELKVSVKSGIATHALVFVFRPYIGNWIQPIACFASENAASGEILQELITKAVVMLYKNNAIVKNIACDGCSTNKSAMKLFGVCGEMSRKTVEDGNSFFFRNPLQRDIKIYWIFDPPHLLKCTRNHVKKHTNVQVQFIIYPYILLVSNVVIVRRRNG